VPIVRAFAANLTVGENTGFLRESGACSIVLGRQRVSFEIVEAAHRLT